MCSKCVIIHLHIHAGIHYIFSHCYHPSAITVMFSETMYSVIENDGPAQPVLVLSNPLATPITVEVTNIDVSATGEYCSINY